MSCRFLTPALVEIRDAAQLYEARVSGLGADFMDEVDATIERIIEFPEAWGMFGEQYRRCHLRHFPFSVIYLIQGDEILVVSLFHQIRPPRSWMRNL